MRVLGSRAVRVFFNCNGWDEINFLAIDGFPFIRKERTTTYKIWRVSITFTGYSKFDCNQLFKNEPFAWELAVFGHQNKWRRYRSRIIENFKTSSHDVYRPEFIKEIRGIQINWRIITCAYYYCRLAAAWRLWEPRGARRPWCGRSGGRRNLTLYRRTNWTNNILKNWVRLVVVDFAHVSTAHRRRGYKSYTILLSSVL